MKKTGFLLCFLLACGLCSAQSKAVVQPPIIVQKLALGGEVAHNGALVHFVEVLEDSRCPQGATCIRAGEAKVKVKIKTENGQTQSAVLVIPRSSRPIKDFLVVQNDTLQIYGLQPYPSYKEIGKKKDYYLQVRWK